MSYLYEVIQPGTCNNVQNNKHEWMMVLVLWCIYNMVTAKSNVSSLKLCVSLFVLSVYIFPESDKIGFLINPKWKLKHNKTNC